MKDTILVSYCSNNEDYPVLIVGRKRPNKSIEIMNAFQGEEATALYKKLVGNKIC